MCLLPTEGIGLAEIAVKQAENNLEAAKLGNYHIVPF
jgi:hypothetical protein